MDIVLNNVEARVLGALIEKEVTTPDYYPLSLNALMNACNQKNNRDPVMTLDESAVRTALHNLQIKRLAGPAGGADSRVTKYGRAERMFRFEELSDVQSTLQRLIERDPQLVKMLPRQPGTKESRYAHLLSGDVEGWEAPSEPGMEAKVSLDDERLAQLESEMAELKNQLAELKAAIQQLRSESKN